MELEQAVNKVHATLREFSEADRQFRSSGRFGQTRVDLAREYLVARDKHQMAIAECEQALKEADAG